MKTIAIHADRALTPFEEISDAVVVIQGSKIIAVGPRGMADLPRGVRTVRAAGKTVVPGFVDVHIHGAGGHDVMEGTPEALEMITATVAAHGTTSLVATTVTASEQETCDSIAGIARFILNTSQFPARELAAEILGIHFEGPFISPARRGSAPGEVDPGAFLRNPGAASCGSARNRANSDAGAGVAWRARRDRNGAQAGLVVSLGHTDATYEQAAAAIEAGATHAAHVYNAMRPFSHRGTGVIGAVLTSPKVSAELIADGVHVDVAAMRILVDVKTAERVILVSDGISATGMPDGKYQLGMFEVKVSGGVARNKEGKLAGKHADAGPRTAEYRCPRCTPAFGVADGDRESCAANRPEFAQGSARSRSGRGPRVSR